MSFPLHSFFIRSVFGASDSKKKLKFWHIAFFLIGLIADTVGTSLMEHIAELTHLHDEIHTVTGTIAILLMFVHALWAIWTYVKGSAKAKKHF